MPIAEIAIVLLLTLINGVLAMSEMAVVSSRQARLEALAKRASAGARATTTRSSPTSSPTPTPTPTP